MFSIDPDQLQHWATSDPSFWERFWGRLRRAWYHNLAGILHTETTPLRIFGFVFKAAALLGIASAPFWIEYTKTQTIGGWETVIMTLVLALLLIISWVHDRIKEHYSKSEAIRGSQRRLALRHEQTINSFVESAQFDQRSAEHSSIVRQKVLCCIEECVRLTLEKFDAQYFQATLLLFEDGDNEMLIAERAKSERPTGTSVISRNCLAYYVASANRVKAIHDIRKQRLVERKGLSLETLPYRSILFLPVVFDNPDNQGTICRGVVTVDSSRPYEFWGSRATDVATQLMPFVRLIALLIQDRRDGITIGG